MLARHERVVAAAGRRRPTCRCRGGASPEATCEGPCERSRRSRRRPASPPSGSACRSVTALPRLAAPACSRSCRRCSRTDPDLPVGHARARADHPARHPHAGARPTGRVPDRHPAGAVLLRLRPEPAGRDRCSASRSTPCCRASGSTTRCSRAVLAITWFVVDAAAAALAPRGPAGALVAPSSRRCAGRSTRASRPPRPWRSWRCSLAVVGAVRLNNGAGGGVALLGELLAAAALLALMVGRDRGPGRDARRARRWSLPACCSPPRCAAGCITGHDIQAEFLVLPAHRRRPALADERAPERLQRLPQRQHPAHRARRRRPGCPGSWSSRCCCSSSSRSCR